MQVYYWGCNDPVYLDSMRNGEKHFKYVDKNATLDGAWMLLGPTKTKLYTIMIKLGRKASDAEITKHAQDYHVQHGILNKNGKKREYVYFIDEVISLPANTTLELQKNSFPQLLKKKHRAIMDQVKRFVETTPARYFLLYVYFVFLVLMFVFFLGRRSARTAVLALRKMRCVLLLNILYVSYFKKMRNLELHSYSQK